MENTRSDSPAIIPSTDLTEIETGSGQIIPLTDLTEAETGSSLIIPSTDLTDTGSGSGQAVSSSGHIESESGSGQTVPSSVLTEPESGSSQSATSSVLTEAESGSTHAVPSAELIETGSRSILMNVTPSNPAVLETNCGQTGISDAMQSSLQCMSMCDGLDACSLSSTASDLTDTVGGQRCPTAAPSFLSADTEDSSTDDQLLCDLTAENRTLTSKVRSLEEERGQLLAGLAERCENLVAAEHRHEAGSRQLREAGERANRLQQLVDAAVRDRDRAVLRFAERERHLTAQQRQLADGDRRLRELSREKELSAGKISRLVQDMGRLRQTLDSKNSEIKSLTKESEMRREELQSRDIRIKWLQNKMTQDSAVHKGTQLRMEQLLNELREVRSQLQLLQQQCTEDSVSVDDDKRDTDVTGPPPDTTEGTVSPDNGGQQSVHGDASCEECELELCQLRLERTSLQRQLDELSQEVASLEETEAALTRERTAVERLEADLSAVQEESSALRCQLDTISAKEAELLSYNMKVTDKNVELQVTCSSLNAQCASAVSESVECRSQLSTAAAQLLETRAQLSAEKEARRADGQLYSRQLAEQSERLQELSQQHEAAQNDVSILTKRYQMAIKERSGELARLRQKCASSAPPSTNGTGSGRQLQQVEEPATVDARVLMDQLIRARRQKARLKERLTDVHEQNRQLVDEVRRKSRLLNSYLLREQSGALSSQHMDETKADMVRMGGIMASVYGSESKDDTMTLDLSLEINRKLQAVLEDTLLKNMTLKDNLNILGQEIERLTDENKRHTQSVNSGVNGCQRDAKSASTAGDSSTVST